MKKFVQILIALMVCASVLLNVHQHRKIRRGLTYNDTITYFDTLEYIMPDIEDSIPLGDISVKLPLAPDIDFGSKKELAGNEEDANHKDLLCKEVDLPFSWGHENDSATVMVPITQKTYLSDNYRAYVSGYMANLDSIYLRIPTRVITRTVQPKRLSLDINAGYEFRKNCASPYVDAQLTYTPPKATRWNLGVQVGYERTGNRMEAYGCINVSYNIFSF